jgi:hypothetical protein
MEEFYKNIGDTLKKTILELMLGLSRESRRIKICRIKPSRKSNFSTPVLKTLNNEMWSEEEVRENLKFSRWLKGSEIEKESKE